VVLRHAGVEYLASRGQSEDKSGLVRWATETMQRAPDSFVDGELMVVPMRTRDGESRGFVALGKPVGQGPRPEDQLLKQLAVLSSVCSDSLVLLDAAARAIRARDDVMAVVSHDLRAPLNNVRLGANLLREGAEPHVVPVLERIERNVTHMTRLVDDLVDMVRLEAGRLQVNPTPENVHELMHAASHLVTEQASVNQLHLQVLDCASHLAVHADRDRVLQVLANLLGNAVKFTSPGGSIELGAHDDGTFVRFTVRDTGRGISPEEGDRVFSRFWQSDPKKRRGLGLGLYIAKGLIQAQGGKLWYESKPGEGTCFSFTLPKPVAGAHARIA
jgi:signal transduction histidine kinase